MIMLAIVLAVFDFPTGNSFYVDNRVYTDPVLYPLTLDQPATQGLSESKLTAGADIIKQDKNARAILVARNGKLVFERYLNGGGPQQSRNIHSASKSILSVATGAAIDNKLISLTTTVQEALGSKFIVPSNKRNITVRHLLTMTSGIAWTEDSTEYKIGKNPVQSILKLGQANTPGTKFNYSTGDATLLAAMLAEKTGNNYAGFVHNTILNQLGITVEKWGIDPQGYYSGGCNLFMTPREMLGFSLFCLDKSIANDSWMLLSTSKQTKYYGMMWWTDIGSGYRAWGWGKQFIYVWPSKRLVCVTAYDTAKNVSDGDNYSTIKRYVLGAIQ